MCLSWPLYCLGGRVRGRGEELRLGEGKVYGQGEMFMVRGKGLWLGEERVMNYFII